VTDTSLPETVKEMGWGMGERKAGDGEGGYLRHSVSMPGLSHFL
jgi:hypothetical protein